MGLHEDRVVDILLVPGAFLPSVDNLKAGCAWDSPCLHSCLMSFLCSISKVSHLENKLHGHPIYSIFCNPMFLNLHALLNIGDFVTLD